MIRSDDMGSSEFCMVSTLIYADHLNEPRSGVQQTLEKNYILFKSTLLPESPVIEKIADLCNAESTLQY